ncbi:MAG: hypothetical protein HY901_31615 [Deltaproteobacteria bacterium]|nr:hypothetical protein [Deltaproteobacteria bacterium]
MRASGRPLLERPWRTRAGKEAAVEGLETQEHVSHLRELALRHGARFEVLPETHVLDHKFVKVGFELQLWGLHEHPKGVTPGCHECVRVYAALKEIAEWVLPKEERPSRYEIRPFEPALHVAPDLKDRDEVLLEIKIVHRHDFFSPIDKCEERCLSEMRQKLGQLGMREGQRRPARS